MAEPLAQLTSIQPLQDTLASRRKAEEAAGGLATKAAEARGEVSGLEREMEARRGAERAGTMTQVEEEATRRRGELAQPAQKAKIAEQLEQPFVPSQANMQDLAGLFSLIGVVGTVIGMGGKRNSMAALSAMNGMVQGYSQGRQDIYKREKDIFESNLKQLKTRYDVLDREFKEALDLIQVDKAAGTRKAEEAFARAGADFYKQYADKFGLAATFEMHKQGYEAAKRATEKAESEVRRAEDLNLRAQREARQAAEAEARAAREERRLGLMERRVGAAEAAAQAKGEGKKEGKPISEAQVVKIEGLDSVSSGLDKLKKDFKPEFASLGVLGFGADFELEARRRLGDKLGTEATRWWSAYNRLQAPNRHALFGATLTGNELRNYQSFTAKPSDSAEVVQNFLDDQLAYTQDVRDQRVLAFESAGYRVPAPRRRDYQETFSGQRGAPAAAQPGAGTRENPIKLD